MISTVQLATYAAGPFLAAGALLVVAGATKLRGRQWPLGVAEIAVGLTGVALGGPAAALVAATYGALAAYAWRQRRVAPGQPCNCLGASAAPVTNGHIALDLGAAAVAAAAAFGPAPLAGVTELPLAGVPFFVLVACCTWLAALALSAYPELRAVQQKGSR